ncbi:MAG: gamma-glutamylcyclotransferase [Candidatus Parcubacteria bacterium]|nr:gamma-glutamylcyclotransferase [Burkholderiales bacterium]
MDLANFLTLVPRGDLWVFGYGSLMWSPEFAHAERKLALVRGYHRALCILSNRLRGTPEKPGVVMGLCRGGSCWGMAFRIRAAHARHALDGLWQREMINNVYMPKFVPVSFKDTQRVQALAFVADTSHRQFIKELDLDGRAQLVAQGIGQRGHCVDYIRNTLNHMKELGMHDPHLSRILDTAVGLASSGKKGK